MPSSRAILRDLEAANLNPKVAHTQITATGHLKAKEVIIHKTEVQPILILDEVKPNEKVIEISKSVIENEVTSSKELDVEEVEVKEVVEVADQKKQSNRFNKKSKSV